MNGYRNYETWNVALWIQKDSGWNAEAVCAKISSDHDKRWYQSDSGYENLYERFTDEMRSSLDIVETPDQVALNDSSLDTETLSEIVAECFCPERDKYQSCARGWRFSTE